MKCHKCGTENQPSDKFCINCGSQLTEHQHHTVQAEHHSESHEHSLKCKQCGADLQKDDKFCIKCGTPVSHHSVNATASAYIPSVEPMPATLPAEQAEKLISDAKHMVRHLSKEEKIMGGASLVALISFFLPWSYGGTNGFSFATSNGWYFLFLLLIIVSLAVTYFTQGAKKNAKIFHTTIQASIGAYIFGSTINMAFYAQLGLLLTILAGATLFGTAIYYQRKQSATL